MNTYLERKIDKDLANWKNAKEHKPLLLRGARQVGKSSAVKHLGKNFKYFLEINFEKKEHEPIKTIFERYSSPQNICEELSAIFNIPIIPKETLLFIDEIQGCIPAISSLRFFYEEMPELHVIAAGSLLEFALKELPSYGVGRISSLFMYPFSFDEFLRANNASILADTILKHSPDNPMSEALHIKSKEYLVKFMLIGGMPEVVSKYVQSQSLFECQQILDEITNSFYNDFSKYKERVPTLRLKEIFSSIIHQTGSKTNYSKSSIEANYLQIKESVALLEMASLIYPVTHTSANGLPLEAETNQKIKKHIIFDTGIYQRFLKLDLGKILTSENITQTNKGAFAEMYTGIEIIKASLPNSQAALYYWQREKQGSQAEIDYVIQKEQQIVPIEIKSGTKGSMQSMHVFLSEKAELPEKHTTYGIRCSMENFAKYQNIDVYPLYAIQNIFN